MEIQRQFFNLAAGVCLLLLTSCLITTLDTVWKDPQYQGRKLKRILVIGIAKSQTVRRVFEDEFVAKLKSYGSDAISSYRIIPTKEMLDKSTIESKIKTLDINAVLITRLVDKKKEREYDIRVKRRNGWYGYYSRSYSYVTASSYYTEYEVLKIETTVYDTKTEEMIWSVLSDTVTGGSNEVEIKSFIKVITKSLSDNQLI